MLAEAASGKTFPLLVYTVLNVGDRLGYLRHCVLRDWRLFCTGCSLKRLLPAGKFRPAAFKTTPRWGQIGVFVLGRLNWAKR